jgi:ABC-2 type transport system permease protein
MRFFTFIRKEFYHILRDKRTLLVLFGMPVVQILLFGFALTNEVQNARIAILDQAHDEASESIITQLASSKYFDIAQNLQRSSQMEPALRSGQARMVVVFPAGFQEDLMHSNRAQIQLVTDGIDPNVATTLVNYASAIFQDYNARLNVGQSMPYQISTEIRMLYNPQQKGAYNFVPGVMAMVLMLVSAMMTSIAIVREKEMGTMEVLLVSPLKPIAIILAKAIPYLTLSLVNVASILLLSVYILDVPIMGNLWLLVAETILFILTSLSLGLLISSVTSSQQIAMLISMMALMLPTIIFSGFMFPIENMPLVLQIISNIVPAKWYFFIVKGVMIKGLTVEALWMETTILTGMTIFLIGVSYAKFKIRLE